MTSFYGLGITAKLNPPIFSLHAISIIVDYPHKCFVASIQGINIHDCVDLVINLETDLVFSLNIIPVVL